MEDNDLFTDCMDTFGVVSQLDQLVEECAEVIVAVNHLKRDIIGIDQLMEELVDVSILTDQFVSVWDSDHKVTDKIRKEKIEKLMDRLTKHKKVL
jgi:NTP pyrophosphatase (non-canonical NTP hydrolase)